MTESLCKHFAVWCMHYTQQFWKARKTLIPSFTQCCSFMDTSVMALVRLNDCSLTYLFYCGSVYPWAVSHCMWGLWRRPQRVWVHCVLFITAVYFGTSPLFLLFMLHWLHFYSVQNLMLILIPQSNSRVSSHIYEWSILIRSCLVLYLKPQSVVVTLSHSTLPGDWDWANRSW